MKKVFSLLSAVVAVAALAGSASAASHYTLDPWEYDPGNTGTVVSEVDGNGDLRLEKNAPTPTNSAAGAELGGVDGMSTTGMTLGFDVDGYGYCGAGAPRFNVYLENGSTVFLGCVHGDADADGTVVFEAGETYGGVLFPEGETVTGIDIVMDEEGQTTLSNISVNGEEVVVLLPAPTNKDQCKNGGWMTFNNPTFKNQGQCVSYVQANENAGKQAPQL